MNKTNFNINPPKLYLLTSEDELELLLKKLKVVLSTKLINMLQIRRKRHQHDLAALKYDIASIIELVKPYNIEVIINDDAVLAQEFATGVHLGKDDGSVIEAKKILRSEGVIGKTCYNNLNNVEKAIDEGVGYTAMGAVFPSKTKPNASKVTVEQLKQGIDLCEAYNNKLCVIGGITTNNVNILKGLNIDYIALTDDILGQNLAEIESKCTQWHDILNNWYKI